MFEPHTFAAYVTPLVTFLRLPLVLSNTGPRPIVVQDLRLVLPDEPGAVLPLPWRNTRSRLDPSSGANVEDLPAVFAVAGFAAQRVFVEFGGPFPGVVLVGRPIKLRVEAVLGHKSGWIELLTFELQAQGIAFPEAYTAYSNRVADIPPDAIPKATAALQRLLKELGLTGREGNDPD